MFSTPQVTFSLLDPGMPVQPRSLLRLFSLGCLFCLTTVGTAAAQDEQPAPSPAEPQQPADPPATPVPPASEEKPQTDEKPQEQPAEPKGDEPKSEEPKSETPTEVKPEKKEPEPPPQPIRLPSLGSMDNPKLPGQPWRVHDMFRPRPPVVAPPVETWSVPPPSDAVILFDGKNMDQWAHRDRETPDGLYVPRWKHENDYFEIVRGTGDLFTIDSFGDLQMHIEWMVPEGTRGQSQGRGNSGIKFLGLYEVQILDSFENRTYADGQAGAIYGQFPPDVNASRPQGQWQSYDIIFEIPKFEGEQLASPGYLTVLYNGVLIHHRRELAGVTGMASPGKYRQHPPAGPIMLQDHGNAIRFRNIWVRPLKP